MVFLVKSHSDFLLAVSFQELCDFPFAAVGAPLEGPLYSLPLALRPAFYSPLHLSSPNCLPGFGKEQAETIVSALITLSNVSLDTVYKDMVTQAQQVKINLQCRYKALYNYNGSYLRI